MRTTIDAAGRVVIPKPIRDALGLVGGTEVDVELDGVSIRINGHADIVEPTLVDGWFMTLDSGESLSVEDVRDLRMRLHDRER